MRLKTVMIHYCSFINRLIVRISQDLHHCSHNDVFSCRYASPCSGDFIGSWNVFLQHSFEVKEFLFTHGQANTRKASKRPKWLQCNPPLMWACFLMCAVGTLEGIVLSFLLKWKMKLCGVIWSKEMVRLIKMGGGSPSLWKPHLVSMDNMIRALQS